MEGLMLGEEMRSVQDRRAVEAMESNVRVRFYQKVVPDAERSVAEGRPVHKSAPYLQIVVPGDKTNAPDKPVSEKDKKRFPKAWAAFMAQEDVPISGTALEAWPQISASEVADLKAQNLRTVEEVAGVGDAHLSVLGLHGRAMRERARVYLEHAKGLAPLSRLEAELSKKDEELAAVRAQLSELQRVVSAQETEPVRRGPGRPPKNQQE